MAKKTALNADEPHKKSPYCPACAERCEHGVPINPVPVLPYPRPVPSYPIWYGPYWSTTGGSITVSGSSSTATGYAINA